jgi:hypothetical protein
MSISLLIRFRPQSRNLRRECLLSDIRCSKMRALIGLNIKMMMFSNIKKWANQLMNDCIIVLCCIVY